MKTLSLLLPLALLGAALATPPPELIDSLSAAAAASATPATHHLVKRGGASYSSGRDGQDWKVYDDEENADEDNSSSGSYSTVNKANDRSQRVTTSKSEKDNSDSEPLPPIDGGRHFRQSAPVAHGPKRLERVSSSSASAATKGDEDDEDEAEEDEGKGKASVKAVIVEEVVVLKKPVNGTRGSYKPLSSNRTLSANSTRAATGPPRPLHYRPSTTTRNSTRHLSPLDHEHRMRKRGIVDDAASMKEQVEAKLGIETKTAELTRVSGKVNGDRHHYWYSDSSPDEDDHKAAHAGESASASARASAAAERISNSNKDKRNHDKRGGKEDFEKAKEEARKARESVQIRKGQTPGQHHTPGQGQGQGAARPTPAPLSGGKSASGSRSSSSKSSASSKSSSSAAKSAASEKHKNHRRDVSDWIADVGNELDAADDNASSSAPGKMVTSTRPPAASSTAAAPAASASSSAEDPSILKPSTWGSAISDEASEQYESLKKKVDGLSVLSKIGLASLVISVTLLLFAILYCCCKLRIRRRRRRAAERVNASLANAQGRGSRTGAGKSFDERATAIPMRGFGSASAPAGGAKEDKKGKRKGSWKTFD
ncbi:hypothetical protein JCM11251_000828 [Rhodosporidiobolus azoricus]